MFWVGTGNYFDIDLSAKAVTKLLGYRRDKILVAFEVYDSNGIFIVDERVEIKTKLPEKTS